MTKHSQQSFRNSELDRAKPRRRFFRSLINNNLKRHRSDTGLVEDRTSSAAVIRIIVALLLLHLIIIGGVILRGKMISEDSIGVAPTITPPPTAAPRQNPEILPQPVAGPVANPVRSANHITQAPAADAAANDDEAEDIEIVTPPALAAETAQDPDPAPAAPAAATVDAKHLVASGETLFGIAKQYGVSIEAIRKANPRLKGNSIISGSYLTIPVRANSEAGRAAASMAQAAAPTGKTYTVKSGENLGLIAKKFHISLNKLLEINNISQKDAGKIRAGAKIKVSE